MRAQELGNRVLPGIGWFLAGLVFLGGLVFNVGNIAGMGLGTNAIMSCCSSPSWASWPAA